MSFGDSLREYILVYILSMSRTRIAKLFKNGSSQAVRLPAEFRFEGDEVYVTRDEVTGDVVLSDRPGAPVWREFFEMVRSIDGGAEFMAERPMNRKPVERNIFGKGKSRR
jgi:antitoxin VapB